MSVKNKKNVQPVRAVNEFPCDIMERSEDGMSVVKVGEHVYYNLDGKTLGSKWARGQLPTTIPCMNTTDGIKLRAPGEKGNCGRTCSGAIGYFYNNTNAVDKNANEVALLSLPFSAGHGFNLLPTNIDRAVSLFSARKLIDSTAFNARDSYMEPNVANVKYAGWQKDSYIYAIVHSSSLQTSIKGSHNGVAYDFKNQFYPFSKSDTYDLLGLAKKTNFKDEKRWCLANGKYADPSPEGQRVLDAFKRCLAESAAARPAYKAAHPELQVEKWDAGYRQLKGLFAEACPDAFKELTNARKALQAKMLPLVYELGFLRK